MIGQPITCPQCPADLGTADSHEVMVGHCEDGGHVIYVLEGTTVAHTDPARVRVIHDAVPLAASEPPPRRADPDLAVGPEIPHATPGQPVTVIFDGVLVGTNPETHGLIVKGNTRGAQHLDWTMEFHWSSTLFEPARETA